MKENNGGKQDRIETAGDGKLSRMKWEENRIIL